MPPWPCTIAFGRPVVPDEKSTKSGWSNGDRLERERRPGRRAGRPKRSASSHDMLAVGHVHDVAERGERGADRRHLRATVDRPVAGSRSRRPRAAPSGSSCASRSMTLRAPSSGAQLAQTAPRLAVAAKAIERLRDVGQVGDDAVAGADTEPLRARRGRGRHCPAARRMSARPAPASASGRRRPPASRSQSSPSRCSREVQARAREPGRSGHRIGCEHGGVRRVRLHLEELPDRRPERRPGRRPTTAGVPRSRRR